jgi:hypothetical protein
MDINLKQKLLTEVYNVLNNTNSGTHNFKKVRRNFLKRLVKDILDLKLDLKSFYFFNNEHLDKLIAYWRGSGNSISTIVNKRSAIAWFLKMIKSDIQLTSAKRLGLQKSKSNNNSFYICDDIKHISYHPISRTILDYQLYFGLTKSESININLLESYKDNYLHINSSLAFNSHERWIPVITHEQTKALQDRFELLESKSNLFDLMPKWRIVNLYDAELLFSKIPVHTKLRKYFIQKQLINFQNQGMSQDDAYLHLMSLTGFKTKNHLLRLAYS